MYRCGDAIESKRTKLSSGDRLDMIGREGVLLPAVKFIGSQFACQRAGE